MTIPYDPDEYNNSTIERLGHFIGEKPDGDLCVVYALRPKGSVEDDIQKGYEPFFSTSPEEYLRLHSGIIDLLKESGYNFNK